MCSVSPGGAVAACPQATDHLVGDGGNYSDLRLIVVHTDGTHRHTIWSPPPGSYDPSDRFDILAGTPAWNSAGTRLAIVVPDTTPMTVSYRLWVISADGSSAHELAGPDEQPVAASRDAVVACHTR